MFAYICSRRVWRDNWTTPTRALGEGDVICSLAHSDSHAALRTPVLQHVNQQIFLNDVDAQPQGLAE